MESGVVKQGEDVTVCDYHESKDPYRGKIVNLYQIDAFGRTPIKEATVGDIVCFSGIEKITIGDTICKLGNVDPLPFVKISEPTVEMTFGAVSYTHLHNKCASFLSLKLEVFWFLSIVGMVSTFVSS